MSPNDSLDGRPDFTSPPGKPLDPNTIVPEDDAALSEPQSESEKPSEREGGSVRRDQVAKSPDDERPEGIPATWSEG